MCLCIFLLTSSIAVKQEGVLELEVQVFGDWLCQVLHTESVHNGEAMPGRCQSETHRKTYEDQSELETTMINQTETVVLKEIEY